MELVCNCIKEQKDNLTIEEFHSIIHLLESLKQQHPEYRQPKFEYDAYGHETYEIPQEMDYCSMCDTTEGGKLCKEKYCNAYLCQDCEKLGCIRCNEMNKEKQTQLLTAELTCCICHGIFPGLEVGSCDILFHVYCDKCKSHNPDV